MTNLQISQETKDLIERLDKLRIILESQPEIELILNSEQKFKNGTK